MACRSLIFWFPRARPFDKLEMLILDRLLTSARDARAAFPDWRNGGGWRRGSGWDEGEPSFAALLEWNKARVHSKAIALFADKLGGGGGGGGEQ
jgi:hypothetical protein